MNDREKKNKTAGKHGEAYGKPKGLIEVRENGGKEDLIKKRNYKTNTREHW